MSPPDKQIKSLIRAIYLVAALLLINMALNLYYHLNKAAPEEPPVQEQKAAWQPRSIRSDIPRGPRGEQIYYGYEILNNTSFYIGPLAEDEKLRLAGNNLNCTNCHLNAGRKIGSGSFVGVAGRFPQFRGRENKEGSLADRINGCMERSMDGRAMAEDQPEMQAIIAYMEWLSEDVPPDIEKLYRGYSKINIPTARADTAVGHALYKIHCIRCHMKGGLGLKNEADPKMAYIYPPIAGDDSYNDGAGMYRVITAAEFIKANMPFGATYDQPQVTDEEAYHLAAYINSLPRPAKTNKELDFPKIELKPVSTPYGPWADSFSAEQHKYGPFQPIMAYYQKEYGLEKSK